MFVVAFASFRLSRFLLVDYGPFMVMEYARLWMGIRRNEFGVRYAEPGSPAEMFTCLWCNSVWTVLFCFLCYTTSATGELLIQLLALMGVTGLLLHVVEVLTCHE